MLVDPWARVVVLKSGAGMQHTYNKSTKLQVQSLSTWNVSHDTMVYFPTEGPRAQKVHIARQPRDRVVCGAIAQGADASCGV